MFNLILKDIMIQKKEKTFWIAILGNFLSVFIVPSNSSLGIIIPFFSIYLLSVYANAFDYKYNGEIMVNSLPVSRKDIVLAKYISVYIYLTIALLLTFSGETVFNLIRVTNSTNFSINYIFINIFIVSVYYSMFIPFYYKLGYVRSRWVNFIAMIIVSITATAIGRTINVSSNMAADLSSSATVGVNISSVGDWITLFIVSSLFIIVSLIISLMIYNKKEIR